MNSSNGLSRESDSTSDSRRIGPTGSQTLVVVVASLLLAACAGAPTVTRVPENKKNSDGTDVVPIDAQRGVFYFLPKSELQLTFEIIQEDVSKGPLDVFLDKANKELPALELTRKEAKSANRIADCTNDKLVRTLALDPKTQLATYAIPDRSQLYFVDVTAKWYQSMNVNLLFSDDGLATELTGGGGSTIPGMLKPIATILTGALLSVDGPTPPPATEKENLQEKHEETVSALRAIAARRDELIYTNNYSGDPVSLMAALDAKEASLRALYEGTLTATTLSIKKRFMPTGLLWPPIKDKASVEPSTDPVYEIVEIELPTCDENKSESATIVLSLDPDDEWFAVARLQEWHAPKAGEGANGFAYRVPVPLRAKLYWCENPKECKEPKKITPATQLTPLFDDREYPLEVAHFGPTLRAPRKAGLWEGSVTVGFAPQSGRLKAFKTDAKAEGASTIVTSVSTEAARDPDFEDLEKRQKELELKRMIKEEKEKLAK